MKPISLFKRRDGRKEEKIDGGRGGKTVSEEYSFFD